jgi:hypothetical protein
MHSEGRAAPVVGSGTAKRFGYVAAALVNAVLLFVANNVLAWGWPAFLTGDFADLLPLINLSLGLTILFNIAYLNYDPDWFKAVTRIGLDVISMVLAVRTFQVFPFDFSAYSFDWDPVARFTIVLAMIGIGIGLLVELVNLLRSAIRSETGDQNAR